MDGAMDVVLPSTMGRRPAILPQTVAAVEKTACEARCGSMSWVIARCGRVGDRLVGTGGT